VSGRAYRSLATIWIPAAWAALENSFHQPSPYASEKPMNAARFTPFETMCSTTAPAISSSFWGALKIQRRFASIGAMIALPAAREIMGVPLSAATSTMASDAGVEFDPTITSTALSAVSLRAFFTAALGSVASSRTT